MRCSNSLSSNVQKLRPYSYPQIAFIFNNIFSEYKREKYGVEIILKYFQAQKSNLKVLTIPLPEITNLNILEDMSLVIFQQTVQEYKLPLKLISLRQLSMLSDFFL